MEYFKITKTKLVALLVFVVTIIGSKTIEKIYDYYFPNNTILIKNHNDTINIVHEIYNPKTLEDDSISKLLKMKIANLKLLEEYDSKIKIQKNIVKATDTNNLPNMIITHEDFRKYKKGYTQGNSAGYFKSECPDLNKAFIELKIEFMTPRLIDEIEYLRLNIFKYDNNLTIANKYYSDNYYEIKKGDNYIKFNNELEKGKYQVEYGFFFKKDLNKDYPIYYSKRCYLTKD